MNRLELEELVRTIAKEVLKSLAESSHPPPGADCECTGQCPREGAAKDPEEDATSIAFVDRLLSDEKLRRIVSNGRARVILSPETIVTPLARDSAQKNQITLQRSSRKTVVERPTSHPQKGKVALLASRCSRSEREILVRAAQEAGYGVHVEASQSATSQAVQDAASRCSKLIAGGGFCRAVILDENAYSLSIQLGKAEGARPAICWDIRSALESREKSDANILLLSNRLLGIPMLAKIAAAWLSH